VKHLLIALFLFAASVPASNAAPKAELWERRNAHDASSSAAIDHGAWARFLKTYLRASPDGVNRIAYAEVGDAGRKRLAGYIAALEAVQSICDIRISSGLHVFASGPWGRKFLKVEGETLSLDDIEHRILRTEPFTAARADAMLSAACRCKGAGSSSRACTNGTGRISAKTRQA
jgi:hypothetical protein